MPSRSLFYPRRRWPTSASGGTYLRPVVYTVLVIFAFLFLSSPVLAGGQAFESNIDWGGYRSFKIPFDEGNAIDIEYEVEVLDGPPVDVIFTNERGFQDYKDPASPSFFFFPHQSSMNTTKASMSFTWVDPGTYYVIVDNSPIVNEVIIEEANVTVKGSVSFDAYDTWVDLCMWLVVAAVVLGVVASVYIMARNRRQRKDIKRKAREDPNFLLDLVVVQRSDKLDGEQRVNLRRVQLLAEGDPELKAEIRRIERKLDEGEAGHGPPGT